MARRGRTQKLLFCRRHALYIGHIARPLCTRAECILNTRSTSSRTPIAPRTCDRRDWKEKTAGQLGLRGATCLRTIQPRPRRPPRAPGGPQYTTSSRGGAVEYHPGWVLAGGRFLKHSFVAWPPRAPGRPRCGGLHDSRPRGPSMLKVDSCVSHGHTHSDLLKQTSCGSRTSDQAM